MPSTAEKRELSPKQVEVLAKEQKEMDALGESLRRENARIGRLKLQRTDGSAATSNYARKKAWLRGSTHTFGWEVAEPKPWK